MRPVTIAAVTTALAVAPLAAQDFRLTRELAAGRAFHLENIIGDVRVTGTSGRTLEVTAVKRAGDDGDPRDVTIEAVDFEGGVAVCVRYPVRDRGRGSDNRDRGSSSPCRRDGYSGNNERNNTSVEFTVRVPAGLQLDIGTVSGDVLAERIDGDLELTSVSGNAELRTARGPRIDVTTVSGDVLLEDVTSKEVEGTTVSGDVRFQGPIEDGGNYDFTTTSGDIRITLPRRPNATLEAASFSGGLSSDLPVDRPEGRTRRHRYSATWGTGSAKLSITTLSGNLAIRVTSP